MQNEAWRQAYRDETAVMAEYRAKVMGDMIRRLISENEEDRLKAIEAILGVSIGDPPQFRPNLTWHNSQTD